jgi:hypothetical protein
MASDAPVKRPWTVMIYMAGDNGKIFDSAQGKVQLMASMTEPGYTDLLEMGAVGTTANAAVTCLFDTTDGTYRIEVRRGRGFADSVVMPVPSVNTGDPNTLCQFIAESVRDYPAEHYALIIWNHGAGWLDVDAYATVRALPGSRSYQPIFRTTPQKLTGGVKTRPIAFDDSSKDFLDTADLRQAFTDAEKETGVRLDLIGMDACLMAMIEGGRELAPYADYFVASQEVEPMAGWPYADILTALNANPGMAPADLADMVVQKYAASYGGKTRAEQTVTQSAVALAHTQETEALCKAVADSILAARSATMLRIVREAVDKTLVFEDPNYRDLGDFANQIASKTEWERSAGSINKAAKALRDHLAARGAGAVVLRVGYLPSYQRACGVSIYLPKQIMATQRQQTLDIYRGLKFTQATGWDQVIDWLLG